MKHLLAFIRLTRAEKKLFIRVVFLLLTYKVRLKSSGLKALYISINNISPDLQQAKLKHFAISPKRLARLLQIASKCVPYSTCLTHALVGKRIFAENGYSTKIHIGVYNDSHPDLRPMPG